MRILTNTFEYPGLAWCFITAFATGYAILLATYGLCLQWKEIGRFDRVIITTILLFNSAIIASSFYKSPRDGSPIAVFCSNISYLIGTSGAIKAPDKPIPRAMTPVLSPGQFLEFDTNFGKIGIKAGNGMKRTITIGKEAREIELSPSYEKNALVFPSSGNEIREVISTDCWKEVLGMTRCMYSESFEAPKSKSITCVHQCDDTTIFFPNLKVITNNSSMTSTLFIELTGSMQGVSNANTRTYYAHSCEATKELWTKQQEQYKLLDSF